VDAPPASRIWQAGKTSLQCILNCAVDGARKRVPDDKVPKSNPRNEDSWLSRLAATAKMI